MAGPTTNQRFRRLPHLSPSPPSTPTPPAPLSSLAYQSTQRENLIHYWVHTTIPRDERGAACSRLVGCHSPRGAKKKNGNQTLKFSMFPPFFFVMLGPIKEPCEGPLEKASKWSTMPSITWVCKCTCNR